MNRVRGFHVLRQRIQRSPVRILTKSLNTSPSTLTKSSWRCNPNLAWTLPAISGVLAAIFYASGDSSKKLEAPSANDAVPGSARNVHSNLIDFKEVARHNSATSCWVVIHGKVYDLTTFISKHPGGTKVVLKHAGKDVSEIYDSLHSPTLLKTMIEPAQYLGEVDPATLPAKEASVPTAEEQRLEKARLTRPPLSSMINLEDIERVAETLLPATSWAYYAGGSEGEYAQKGNRDAYKHYWFRPRILRPVEHVDTSTTMLGIKSTLPFFICPAALAGLGHPEGEVNLTRAAGKMGIIQGISSNASRSIDDIAAARTPGQPLFFQLYINRDRKISEEVVRKVERLGFKAILLTVDTPVLGRREMDMRTKSALHAGDDEDVGAAPKGVAGSVAGYFDLNLSWSDIAWLRSITSLPIVLKGIQCVEDVELAVSHGVDGVLLSNHGGRQLDFAPASIDILYELRQRRPDIFGKCSIFVDGGVRRGTDVLKALALGASGVGLGRPFLYANAAYGEKGAIKAIQLLEDEILTSMRLLGVTKISELKPEMVRYLDREPPR